MGQALSPVIRGGWASPPWLSFSRRFHLAAHRRPCDSPSEQNTTKTNSLQIASLTLTSFSLGDTISSLVFLIQLIRDGLRSRPAAIYPPCFYPLSSQSFSNVLLFSVSVTLFVFLYPPSPSLLHTHTHFSLDSIHTPFTPRVYLPLHLPIHYHCCHHRHCVQPKATTAS